MNSVSSWKYPKGYGNNFESFLQTKNSEADYNRLVSEGMSKTSLEDVRIISQSEKKEKDSFPRARDFSLDGAGENSQYKEKPEGNT